MSSGFELVRKNDWIIQIFSNHEKRFYPLVAVVSKNKSKSALSIKVWFV